MIPNNLQLKWLKKNLGEHDKPQDVLLGGECMIIFCKGITIDGTRNMKFLPPITKQEWDKIGRPPHIQKKH